MLDVHRLNKVHDHGEKFHLSALDPAHVQNIVNDAQKLLSGVVDLFQIVILLLRARPLLSRQGGKADDRVHGRADIVGHAEQELAFGPAHLLRQDLLPLQLIMMLSYQSLDIKHHHQPHKGQCNQQKAVLHDAPAFLLGMGRFQKFQAEPHQQRIEKQRKQYRAGRGNAAVILEGALLHGSPVENKPQKAPQRQQKE